jgi:hypothetical protein
MLSSLTLDPSNKILGSPNIELLNTEINYKSPNSSSMSTLCLLL